MREKCDKCEREATQIVRDLKENPPEGNFRTWEGCQGIRKGCELHPVSSRRYTLDGSVTEDKA